MICPNCGAEGSGKFCPTCGTSLQVQTESNSLKEKTSAGINNLEEKVNCIDSSKLIRAIGMIPTFFWVPIVADRKNKDYCLSASNGLMLRLIVFAISVVFGILFDIIGFLPLSAEVAISGFVSVLSYIRDILYFGCDILSYIGFVMVFLGKDFTYPIFGKKNLFENLR